LAPMKPRLKRRADRCGCRSRCRLCWCFDEAAAVTPRTRSIGVELSAGMNCFNGAAAVTRRTLGKRVATAQWHRASMTPRPQCRGYSAADARHGLQARASMEPRRKRAETGGKHPLSGRGCVGLQRGRGDNTAETELVANDRL
jgi:hypothetical protein